MPNPERLREEEEYGGGGGGAYVQQDSFKNRHALDQWWQELTSGMPQKFPLYAVFLATESDEAIASFVIAHRQELKAISGPACCLVYFRNLDAASKGTPWSFSEHAAMVYPITRIMGMNFSDLPCLVFFKAITSGQYVRVDLKDLSDLQLLTTIRQAFSYASSHSDPFRGVRAYNHAFFWTRTGESIRASALAMAKKLPEAALLLLKMKIGQ